MKFAEGIFLTGFLIESSDTLIIGFLPVSFCFIQLVEERRRGGRKDYGSSEVS